MLSLLVPSLASAVFLLCRPPWACLYWAAPVVRPKWITDPHPGVCVRCPQHCHLQVKKNWSDHSLETQQGKHAHLRPYLVMCRDWYEWCQRLPSTLKGVPHFSPNDMYDGFLKKFYFPVSIYCTLKFPFSVASNIWPLVTGCKFLRSLWLLLCGALDI